MPVFDQGVSRGVDERESAPTQPPGSRPGDMSRDQEWLQLRVGLLHVLTNSREIGSSHARSQVHRESPRAIAPFQLDHGQPVLWGVVEGAANSTAHCEGFKGVID